MIAINEITHTVIGAAFKVHSKLGPGLLENSYKECLFYEIGKTGLYVEKEKLMPLLYEKVSLDIGYRLDIYVEETVVVEVKAVDCFNNIHIAQVLTYLKLSQSKVGLLLNFNVEDMKKGIKRVIL